MVSQTLLAELKTILKKDYDLDLNPEDTASVGNALVNYFGLLAKISGPNYEYEKRSTNRR